MEPIKVKKNVILVDYNRDYDWDFLDGLQEVTGKKWLLECQESSGDHGGIKNLIRYFKYFTFPIHIVRKRKTYEKVITWQQFHGIILSFYYKLFHIKKDSCPELYVMELIYKPKGGLVGKIYNNFIRYSIQSPYITKIFVFSKDERNYYKKLFRLKNEIIESTHLGIEDSYEKFRNDIRDDGYYVAAGRSNRDYEFLLNEWPKSVPLKIICDNRNLNVNGNVEQLTSCYRDEYHRVLARAHGVIIPLEDENASSGQLVMLQAMMLGKPVIVTENRSVCDYLLDNKDGFIIRKNGDELRNAIKVLNNHEVWKRMSCNCREHFVTSHSQKAMGRSVGKSMATQK